MTSWTTSAAVRERALRRWRDGSLLSAYVVGGHCPVLDVAVRGPSPREIGAQLAQVRSWRDALVKDGRGDLVYTVSERAVGGRVIGHMTVPDRVRVVEFGQWWRLLGVADQVRVLDEVVATTRARRPELLEWVARRPLVAIELAGEWDRLLAALDWVGEQAGRSRYLREVTARGVDTKFIERHGRVLGELVDVLRPGLADEHHSAAGGFARRYGFREPERLLRMRLDPALRALPAGLDEVGLPIDQAAGLHLDPAQVLIIENQVTYLSVPLPPRGIVLWGHGFDALRLGRLDWLAGRDGSSGRAGPPSPPRVRYWGDIDTHGFAILDGLRSQVPHVESVLMDRGTLLAHRDRWVREPRPTRADLARLDVSERLLYEELVEDVHGPAVRLEQEREAWDWCLRLL